MVAHRAAQRVPWDAVKRTEAMRIHSAAGLLHGSLPFRSPPFRAPHHTVSTVGLVGDRSRLGEASLAHGGVLFLDEAAEFPRAVLESVALAYKQGEVRVVSAVNAAETTRLPARFHLILAANPCACGGRSECACDDDSKRRWKARIDLIIGLTGAVRIDMDMARAGGVA
jgi:magnesium chelatase family protein